MTNPPASNVVTSTEDHEFDLQFFLSSEKNFYRDNFSLWLGTLIGPGALTLILFAAISAVTEPVYWSKLANAAFWSFVLLGRFTIVASASLGIPATHLFWMVTYQDVMVGLFCAFHVGFIYRLPWIGNKIAALSADSEFILAHQPWMKKLTFLGLIAFIAFPLGATGSVGGAVFGRLLGLSRWSIFWGSAIGAVIGNSVMLVLHQTIAKLFPQLQDDPILKWGGIAVVLVIILILERRYRTLKHAYLSKKTPIPVANE